LKTTNETGPQLSTIYTSFVDILFAVVLAQSFILLADPTKGGKWFSDPVGNLLTLADVVLAYTLVVTSWVGYHRSVLNVPIKSIWRFFLDLVLLFLYWYAFASVQYFGTILVILFAVFVVYLAWTAVRIYEYRTEGSPRKFMKRTVHALIFCIVFLALILFRNYVASPVFDGMLWVIAFAVLLGYRALNWRGIKLSGS
jgi:hypothetical protein